MRLALRLAIIRCDTSGCRLMRGACCMFGQDAQFPNRVGRLLCLESTLWEDRKVPPLCVALVCK